MAIDTPMSSTSFGTAAQTAAVSSEADPSTLQRMPAPAELVVPCATRPPFDRFEIKPPGSDVAKGELLTHGIHPSEQAALSPVAGKVIGAARARLLSGLEVPAVRIQADAQQDDDPDPSGSNLPSLQETLASIAPGELSPWIDRLRSAGVWADRWTSPDLLGQLHQCLRRPIDTIICNALDSDSGLPLQGMLTRRYAAELVAGVALLAKLTEAGRRWIAMDDGVSEETWINVRAQVDALAIRPIALANDYPQSNPTLLLHTLTRRKLKPGKLPTEQGVLLFDAATAVAIGQAMVHGIAMLRVPIGVYDVSQSTAHFLWVCVGSAVVDVLAYLGIEHNPIVKAGPPLQDKRPSRDAIVCGNELTLYAMARARDVNPDPCIRCGWCVQGCPVRIQPAGLLEAAQLEDSRLAELYGIDACIECGICSYVCPSQLPLLEGIRKLRRPL